MQNFFKRRERKYLITNEQGGVLQEEITRYMKMDQHGEYLVQNLYYDTEDWSIIRECLGRPMYKGKLRLRFYDKYNTESLGFLELKNKLNAITYKRRIAFPLCELESRSVGQIVSARDSQISKEISFFMKRKPVSEKIYIAYRRAAYTGIGNENLRITFDRGISFCLCPQDKYNFSEYEPGNGSQILERNQMLMEIKIAGAMPLWLAQALSANNIFPLSFSKFGACYTKHIMEEQDSTAYRNFEEAANVA